LQNFEKRRDRFEFFDSFENPLLNITVRAEVPNFLPFCRQKGYPPFHFFLYCLFEALKKNENFLYRLYQGQVIKISEVIPSYTVMNTEQVLNYTRFSYSSDLNKFIENSLQARTVAMNTPDLINTGLELDERSMKNYVFVTSIPWLDFTSIQHPVFRMKSADIPSLAWGKFKEDGPMLNMPFSVQGHHGFIDGYHVYQLLQSISHEVEAAIG
jgi:chloramphenicol O-acetyltransferase type A